MDVDQIKHVVLLQEIMFRVFEQKLKNPCHSCFQQYLTLTFWSIYLTHHVKISFLIYCEVFLHLMQVFTCLPLFYSEKHYSKESLKL